MRPLRVILWCDGNGITHAVRQSKNHHDDWDPLCNSMPQTFGFADPGAVMDSIRHTAWGSVVPVEGPVTCLACAAKYTG